MKDSINLFKEFADETSRVFGKSPEKREEKKNELAAQFDQAREEQQAFKEKVKQRMTTL